MPTLSSLIRPGAIIFLGEIHGSNEIPAAAIDIARQALRAVAHGMQCSWAWRWRLQTLPGSTVKLSQSNHRRVQYLALMCLLHMMGHYLVTVVGKVQATSTFS